MKKTFPLLQAIVFTIFLITTASSAFAAPRADLWDFWLSHDESSTATVDHSYWNTFLKAYVVTDKDGINKVMYDRVSQQNRQALSKYINNLAKTSVRSSSFRTGSIFIMLSPLT